MFYGYEKTFKSLNQLEQAIIDYIDYYNNKRIKVKLKGLILCSTELNPLDKLFV
ncbi:IS3 family transposase [Streptococcus pneumoniae]|uniref:IS3 family transposase n=1 Tax=Streptococcus pneumoniae TaxID=1313 RepID=UPI00356B5679